MSYLRIERPWRAPRQVKNKQLEVQAAVEGVGKRGVNDTPRYDTPAKQTYPRRQVVVVVKTKKKIRNTCVPGASHERNAV